MRSRYGRTRGHRVDPQPQQVRGVEVEVEPEREHPLPQLRRVGQVAGVAVGVPALHRAVLDHQPHAALAGPVDQRREHRSASARFSATLRAGSRPTNVPTAGQLEQRGRLDARRDVRVHRPPRFAIGVQVVVVVGERRQLEAVAIEQRAHARRPAPCRSRATSMWPAVNSRSPIRRPGGHLERLVAGAARPGGDRGQLQLGQAGGQEPQPHVCLRRLRRRRHRWTRSRPYWW